MSNNMYHSIIYYASEFNRVLCMTYRHPWLRLGQDKGKDTGVVVQDLS